VRLNGYVPASAWTHEIGLTRIHRIDCVPVTPPGAAFVDNRATNSTVVSAAKGHNMQNLEPVNW
jgi:hypothetical protein